MGLKIHGETYERMGKWAWKVFDNEEFLGNSQLNYDSKIEAEKALKKYIKTKKGVK